MQAFPVYKVQVLKAIDRGHEADAFHFYQSGIVRPLVELLGMIYRPFQYDFGLRYIYRSFPGDLRERVRCLCYVKDLGRKLW